jgi:hypothetical protein
VKAPRPATIANGEEQQQQPEELENREEGQPLPVTLVRIPTQLHDPRQRNVEAEEASS